MHLYKLPLYKCFCLCYNDNVVVLKIAPERIWRSGAYLFMAYFTENLYTVVRLYTSPGESIVFVKLL